MNKYLIWRPSHACDGLLFIAYLLKKCYNPIIGQAMSNEWVKLPKGDKMKENRRVVKMLFLITQLGITMLTSIFLCMFIGLWIDGRFGTHFFIPFLLLGIGGGFKGVYNLIIRANGEESEDDQRKTK